MLRPRGVGGVASVVDAVAPHLAAARVLPVAVASRASDVRALVREARARDVVHLNPSFRHRALLRDGAVHRLVRAQGARTLVHWHGVDRTLVDRIDRSWTAQRLVRRLFGDASATFVLVPELASALERWGLGPASVVRNPAPRPGPRGPVEPHRVLFLGRLDEDKGVHALVHAIRLLRRRFADATLALAGAGPVAVEGPGVEALGWIDTDRRGRELARASVLALPTRDDAAPMAILEALAAGVPVVATRIGAIPSMVGPYGVLVDRPDPASLARALTSVWSAPPSMRGLARHLEPYRPEAIARRWSSAWSALAKGLP